MNRKASVTSLALAALLFVLLAVAAAAQDPPVAPPSTPSPTTPYFVMAIVGLAGAIGVQWRAYTTQVETITLKVAQQVEAATKANAAELLLARTEAQKVLELERAAWKEKLAAAQAELDREREECRKELNELRDRVDKEQTDRRVESQGLLREQQAIMREVVTVCDGVKHVVDKSTNTISELAARFDEVDPPPTNTRRPT